MSDAPMEASTETASEREMTRDEGTSELEIRTQNDNEPSLCLKRSHFFRVTKLLGKQGEQSSNRVPMKRVPMRCIQWRSNLLLAILDV